MNAFDEEEILDVGKPRRDVPPGRYGLLVTFALVIGVVVWLAMRGGSPLNAASGRPGAGASSASTPSTRQDPTHNSAECPYSVACQVPRGTMAVLREYVPRAVATSGYTMVRTSGERVLWFRQLDAHVARTAITLMIAHRDRSDPPEGVVDLVDARNFSFVREWVNGYSVQVEVAGARSARPSQRALQRLVRDPRLERLP